MADDPNLATLKEVRDFFKTEGETLTQFGDEWKKLTDEDKVQIRTGIKNGSLNY